MDARKTSFKAKDAVELTRGMEELIVAKGKKVVRVDLKNDRPDDKALAALLLGPTGNLRAPTFRVGRTLVVGFSEEAYKDVLKK